MVGDLRVVESGDGPPLVLVHGAMDRAGGLARTARHLRDHRVLRYDRRGYGGSASRGPGRLVDHVQDLIEVLATRTADGPTPATVVGHSFGGLVALGAAALAPDLVGAVGAYEPPLPWVPDWPRGIEGFDGSPEEAADLVIERAVGAERWARAPAALRAVRRSEGGALVTEMRSLVTTAPGGAPAPLGPVVVPGLLGVGSHVAPDLAQALAAFGAALGGLRTVVLEGCGHRAPVTDPAVFAAWCREVAEADRPSPARAAAEVVP